MALIDGLDDAISREYERLRDELRIAIAESGYTINEIGALTDVEPRTIYRMLAGRDVKLRDTLIRVLFAVGGRIEIARPGEEGARPFRAVPLDPTSTPSIRSISSSNLSKSDADKTQGSERATAKKAAEQPKRSSPRKRHTRGYEDLAA